MQTSFVLAPICLLRGLGTARRSMGVTASRPSRTAMTASVSGVEGGVRAAIKENNVMVFSALYCPYCRQVKSLFNELGVEYNVWELDERRDGDEVKQFLINETGQRTIPKVYIKENFIGGCDDTMDLHEEGKLLDLVSAPAS